MSTAMACPGAPSMSHVPLPRIQGGAHPLAPLLTGPRTQPNPDKPEKDSSFTWQDTRRVAAENGRCGYLPQCNRTPAVQPVPRPACGGCQCCFPRSCPLPSVRSAWHLGRNARAFPDFPALLPLPWASSIPSPRVQKQGKAGWSLCRTFLPSNVSMPRKRCVVNQPIQKAQGTRRDIASHLV